jgi:hypothetical protein
MIVNREMECDDIRLDVWVVLVRGESGQIEPIKQCACQNLHFNRNNAERTESDAFGCECFDN